VLNCRHCQLLLAYGLFFLWLGNVLYQQFFVARDCYVICSIPKRKLGFCLGHLL
jgi:hypothetical protein